MGSMATACVNSGEDFRSTHNNLGTESAFALIESEICKSLAFQSEACRAKRLSRKDTPAPRRM